MIHGLTHFSQEGLLQSQCGSISDWSLSVANDGHTISGLSPSKKAIPGCGPSTLGQNFSLQLPYLPEMLYQCDYQLLNANQLCSLMFSRNGSDSAGGKPALLRVLTSCVSVTKVVQRDFHGSNLILLPNFRISTQTLTLISTRFKFHRAWSRSLLK